MTMISRLLSAMWSDPDFEGLGEEQNQAVIDALIAVIFGDARLDPKEVEEFDRQIRQLPWRWAQDERQRESVIAVSREKVDHLGEPGAAAAFVQSVAQRLPAQPVREKVFQMCAALVAADGVIHPDEQKLLDGLGQAFAIDEARAAALRAAAERG